MTQGSIYGVGIDNGAHLQGVVTKQYKTINATAPLSKACRENSKPCVTGARVYRGNWSPQKQQRRSLIWFKKLQLALHIRGTCQGNCMGSQHCIYVDFIYKKMVNVVSSVTASFKIKALGF